MKQCYFCKGPMSRECVRVIEERGERLLVFENVPAQLCGCCGQRYYSAAVLEEMDRLADSSQPGRTISAGILTFPDTRECQTEAREVVAAS